MLAKPAGTPETPANLSTDLTQTSPQNLSGLKAENLAKNIFDVIFRISEY